jgi:fructosamine-3-kinase
MSAHPSIGPELARLTGRVCAPAPERRVGGGNISSAYAWRCGAELLFVKTGPPAMAAAFAAEARGLALLEAAAALRVPRVRARGAAGNEAFLALEWLELRPPDAQCAARAGTQLAALHAHVGPRFGLDHDNLIGRTPQQNAWDGDWATFFRERRLRPQLALATTRGFGELRPAGDALLAAVPALLAGHSPAAALLHGDLWGGNWASIGDGVPVVFDPAAYYGDPEADLAMTALFGGFGDDFYRAYAGVWPRKPGWRERADLYNLYHVLNHANLFGGRYVQHAHGLMRSLLALTRG